MLTEYIIKKNKERLQKKAWERYLSEKQKTELKK